MTSKSSWRGLERRICNALGGRRTPLSGSNSQHGTSADCIETKYPSYYFEIKLRQSFLHHTMFKDKVEKQAIKEGKIPVLITHVKNAKLDSLAILRLEDLIKLLGK